MKFIMTCFCTLLLTWQVSADAKISHMLLDINAESLPKDPVILTEFMDTVLMIQPEIIYLHNIVSEALSYDFYETLQGHYDYFYIDEGLCYASKNPIEMLDLVLARTEKLGPKTNVKVTIKDASKNQDIFLKLLEYTTEQDELYYSSFFDEHPFMYQREGVVILCRGGKTALLHKSSYG